MGRTFIEADLNTTASNELESGIVTKKKVITIDISTERPAITADISTKPKRFTAEFVGLPSVHDRYSGDYVITPTGDTQVLATRNKLATDNITINPIPSNYGLITWDGAVLTVS